MKEKEEPTVAESPVKPISRRSLLQGASAATVVGMIGSSALAQAGQSDKAAFSCLPCDQ